ncbi:acyl-CoA thioesterase [Pedobacter antarcticus]|uniref:Thioesterase n=2 Tax=Pedobacter antarcticus TaxID=34086 RepID=A0A081PKW2_9SPHI|nr:acyl-CoA thioesterase [Pedobacter antarcticus]KEQ31335.1 thioesterase [Pedobacter antarcticus 4BY]SDL47593.1 thioesterase-3 [Pedobacter antarcticus]SFE37386.1 thioesterase-3 [Pedobacter antarcticus]
MEKTAYSVFETELKVRPDDIDMFNHVHNSKYFDYVLAARYDQMELFYKMPMESFLKSGLGWVVRTAMVEFKRPLILGDQIKVRTGILTINEKGCRVQFEIENIRTGKIASDGWFDYVMIDISTGKGCKVDEDMIKAYSI